MMCAMLTVENALSIIREKLNMRGETLSTLEDLHQEVLAQDLIADRDYPPFDRVMMDGIAVNYNVFSEGKKDFRIEGICPAGSPAGTLNDPSGCLEVMTGAPLPHGCDLVIPYEHLKIDQGHARIMVLDERAHLEHVHLKGSDARQGEILLSKGSVTNGPGWGIATSLGYSKIQTIKKPRINIISTGDELVSVETYPLPHQIRRSNAYALKASLVQNGFTDVELSHLNDDVSAIEEHYKEASQEFDLLIYSGGVSKGKFDYLPETWKRLGVCELVHGVSQRPGKPLWFGVDEKTSTSVLGLPGNPVSSLVCLYKYFLNQKDIYAVLDEEIIFKKDLTCFVPVKVTFEKNGSIKALPLKIKNSGEFSALAGSDGFIELPKDQSQFKKGESFLYIPWRRI